MTRRLALVAVLGISLALSPGVEAYLKLGVAVGNQVIALKWGRQPVRYYVPNRAVPGVTTNELRATLGRAFATWGAVSTASVSSEFVGFTSVEPNLDNQMSEIGFTNRPDLDTVLGSTDFVVDDVTGEIVESDIFFNAAFSWSVAPQGEASRYDLESIAVHEIGHLFGLSHSALGETTLNAAGQRSLLGKRAVMFPIAYPPANIEDRTLDADDIAGISDVYGTDAFRTGFGSISGRVLLNGAGVFGAHVVAFNPGTGTLTGGFTLTSSGQFVIGGLEPGVYVVRAEPLDDADLDGFFNADVVVNTSFRPAYAASLVGVPAGGSRSSIEIRVSPK